MTEQAQGAQICDAQRIALIAYGDARESKDPERIATAFVNALHTHPQATEPAGWKLVPVEPMPEMLIALINEWDSVGGRTMYENYRAMLAAAPEAHHE